MLTAYYDLATSPPTYDIVSFLCEAERVRIKQGKQRIAIEFLPGPRDGFRDDKFWPFNRGTREQMLHRVAIPMARLLPCVASVVVRTDRPKPPVPGSIGCNGRMYGTRLFMTCMGARIRPLRPPQERTPNPRLVTITLREAEHWPERNSNVPEWQKAAEAIRARGFDVVVVRETSMADVPLGDLTIDAEASRDLFARGALYRSAACNLFVNNGPGWFAMALDAPVLMLKPTVENLMPTCSAAFFHRCGVPVGGQIPGSPDYQRIVWAEDDAPAIIDAFDRYSSRSSQVAAG